MTLKLKDGLEDLGTCDVSVNAESTDTFDTNSDATEALMYCSLNARNAMTFCP